MSIGPADIAGVVLAGGQGRRMGGLDKGLVALGGRPLIAHAVERLQPQVGALVLSVNGDPARFARFALPVVADAQAGFAGPLAGILAGMVRARGQAGARFVATVAVDTPFFPADLVARLAQALDGGHDLAVAESGGRVHPVFGLFPVALADDLARFLDAGGDRAVMAWIGRHRTARVRFARSPGAALDPFFNINTPADLALAEAAGVTELRKN